MENVFSLQKSIENFLENHDSFVRKISQPNIDVNYMSKDHLSIVWDSQSTIFVAIREDAHVSEIRTKIYENTGASKKCYSNYIKGDAWCGGHQYWNYFFELGKSQLVRVIFCKDNSFDYITQYLHRTKYSKTRDIINLDPIEKHYGAILGI